MTDNISEPRIVAVDVAPHKMHVEAIKLLFEGFSIYKDISVTTYKIITRNTAFCLLLHILTWVWIYFK